MTQLNQILNYELLGNDVVNYLVAILLFLILFFGLKTLMHVAHQRLENLTKDKKKNILIILMDFIKNTPKYFFLTLEVYIPLKTLALPNFIENIIDVLFALVVILQVIRLSNKLLVRLLQGLFKKQIEIDKTSQNAIQLGVKVIVWVLGLLLLLSNIGIEVTPLLASLGIGGIAVAFALQKVLADLFASFSILTSKPFHVGDWIKVGDKGGSVVDITLKATYLHAISGEKIIIPNSEVLGSSIDNYGKMPFRRKRFEVGVAYETSPEKLKKIPQIIQDIVEPIGNVEYEWAHLVTLADFSINFKISYKLLDPAYSFYLSVHEQITLELLEAFQKEKIEIAYPTQVVYTPDIKSIK